jgi:hypothetical protein
MKMRFSSILVLVLAVFAAGACTPESIRHLPDELRVPADMRLVGKWLAQILGNEHEATVTAGADDTLVVALRSATVPSGGVAPWQTRHVLPLRLQGEVRARGPLFYDFLLTAFSDEILRVLRTVPPAKMWNVSFGPFVRQ